MDAATWLQCVIILSLVRGSLAASCLNVTQTNQCYRYKETCFTYQEEAFNCTAGEHYHCARNAANLTRFIQRCAKPKICGIGTEPVIDFDDISGKTKAQIKCEPCYNKDWFNPINSTWSYKISRCHYKKQDCSVNQVECEYENANDQFTKNRRIRCDVKNGYTIAKHYYDPEESACRIWDGFTCQRADCYPKREVSLKGYRCIDKCPAGQSRSDENSDDCIAMSTTGPVVTPAPPEGVTTPRPLDTTVRITAAPTRAPTPKPPPYKVLTTTPGSSEKETHAIVIIIAVVVSVLIVSLIVGVIIWIKCRKKAGNGDVHHHYHNTKTKYGNIINIDDANTISLNIKEPKMVGQFENRLDSRCEDHLKPRKGDREVLWTESAYNNKYKVADGSGNVEEAVPQPPCLNNSGAGGDSSASRPNSQHFSPVPPSPSGGAGDSAGASRRSSPNFCDKEPSSLRSSKASLPQIGPKVTEDEGEPLLSGIGSDSGDGGDSRQESQGLSLSHGSKANPPEREQSLTDGPYEEPIAQELAQKSGTARVERTRRLSRSTSDVRSEKERTVKTEAEDKEIPKSSSLHDVPSSVKLQILMHKCLSPDKKTEMMKYAIDRCILYLKENMDPRIVPDKFQEKEIFTFMTVRDMKEKELTTDKNDRILDNVRRSGWDKYIEFKIILKETKQEECVKQLQNKEQCFIKDQDECHKPEEHNGETLAEKGESYIDDTNEATGDPTCPNDLELEEEEEVASIKAAESLKQLAKCTTIKEFQTEADSICRQDVPIIEQTCEPWSTQKIHVNNCPPGFDSYSSSGQQKSCLYQSVGILLTGHEACHKRLRLLAALHGAIHLQDIIAHMKQRLADKLEDYKKGFLVSMMKSSVDEEGNKEQTIEKCVEKIVMETAALGVDSCQLHVYLLSQALGRPIKSYYQTPHYGKDQDDILNTHAGGNEEPLNIMWVNHQNHQNNTNEPLNHVIPLKPHTRQIEQS